MPDATKAKGGVINGNTHQAMQAAIVVLSSVSPVESKAAPSHQKNWHWICMNIAVVHLN